MRSFIAIAGLFVDMKTHITFVLDSSGSMSVIKEDTIGGFNEFLTDQRDEPGEATVSLYEFDDDVESFYQMRPIGKAPELAADTYNPGGSTALHDAIAMAIDETGAIVEGLPEADRPDNVIVVVLTDGKENASETPEAAVRERVTNRQEHHGWEFLFIGANQDAALAAESMGMDKQNALDMDHSGDGAEAAYDSTSARVSEARSMGYTDGFDDEDRKRQEEAGDSQ